MGRTVFFDFAWLLVRRSLLGLFFNLRNVLHHQISSLTILPAHRIVNQHYWLVNLMSLYTVTTSFLLNQNPSKPQLLVAHCLSIMFHAVMHSFSMRYWRFAAQRLHWNTLRCVEMLLYQRLMACFGQGDWLPGCLGSSISDLVSQWEENLGLMNNSSLSGAATTAVCLPLLVFPSLICLLITSFFALLCLCLPVFLLVSLSYPFIVAVSPSRCWRQGEQMGGCRRRL